MDRRCFHVSSHNLKIYIYLNRCIFYKLRAMYFILNQPENSGIGS